jgi:hypothetical protein
MHTPVPRLLPPRLRLLALVSFLAQPLSTSAEVTSVTITSQTMLAGG